MGKGGIAALCVAALVAGCGGGSAAGGSGGSGGGSPSAGGDTTRTVEDRLIGYELALPPGWTAPAETEPGAAVALGGGGEGCTVGTAGPLPAIGGREALVA